MINREVPGMSQQQIDEQVRALRSYTNYLLAEGKEACRKFLINAKIINMEEQPIEPTKPQRSLIPEARLNEMERLAEITGHNIDAIIAGYWYRFSEVQTLQIENDYKDSLIKSLDKIITSQWEFIEDVKKGQQGELKRAFINRIIKRANELIYESEMK